MSRRLGEHIAETNPNWVVYFDADSLMHIGVNDADKTTAQGETYVELMRTIDEIDRNMAQIKASDNKNT